MRDGEIGEELLQTFDRAVELRAKRARLKDELMPLEKRLQVLMREAFGGDHWCFGGPSPADGDYLDSVRHHPIGGGTQLDRDWPLLQRDRNAIVAAHATWKQRRKAK
jgi:hypothetical protein